MPHTQPSLERGNNPTDNKDISRICLGEKIKEREDINITTRELLLASWKQGTHKQYQVYLNKWQLYCKDLSLSTDITIGNVLNFLTSLFEQGLSYSAINTARSALSSLLVIEGKAVGTHPLVIRLLKGIFNKRPSLPKNKVSWDPELMLGYLKTLSPVANLSLLKLSWKTVALLLLLTGQRGQSIHLLDIRNLTVSKNSIKIRFGDSLKSTRPGFHQHELYLKGYAPDRRLCIVTVLQEYLERTAPLRNSNELFITTQKPHSAVSRDTISRWFRNVMEKSGVDTKIFTPHSVRSASTSAASKAKIPLSTILSTAGWTKDTTFQTYYKKPIQPKNNLML